MNRKIITKKYNHLFFDLDNTLWDFSYDAKKTFEKLISKYNLLAKIDSNNPDLFLQAYKKHNLQLWEEYKKEEITKEHLSVERFRRPLSDFGCQDKSFAKKLSEDYIETLSGFVTLFPETISILDYLKPKYNLHAITNGFEEVQIKKLMISGLNKYFSCIITSEMAEVRKPDKAIYDFSLSKAGATSGECLMIGDDPESDIEGASAAGIDQCWLKLNETDNCIDATYVICSLGELKGFL